MLPNENVIAVLCGHYHDSATLVDAIDDDGDGIPDRQVYQMLGDYQGGPEGGQGYMKLLHFDQNNNKIMVNTYSPYLDNYNFYDPIQFPEKDERNLEVDLQPQLKRVATDYFTVNIYTDKEIGKVEKLPSGSIAQTEWQGLAENQTYSWYVVAEDDYTGKAVSDIWTFTKGKDESGAAPEETSDPGDNPGNKPGDDQGNIPGGNDGTPPVTSKPDDLGQGKSPAAKDPDKKQAAHGSQLPSTATNTFNIILIGILIITIGGIIWLVRRKMTEV